MRLPVRLTNVQQTLLLTLYLRALESRSTTPVLGDPMAERLVACLDYDFTRFDSKRGDPLVALRALSMDRQVARFCARHPDAVVVHLACGLDSRAWRVDPPATVQWYDVDYPEVVELRRALYPERPGYRSVAADVTEPDWLEGLPGDRPTMVVAEGLVMYLPAAEVERLVTRIVGHFHDGEVMFDVFSRVGATVIRCQPSFRATGATIRSVLPDRRVVERWSPRLRFIAERPVLGEPEVVSLPRGARVFYTVLRSIPALRGSLRTLHYAFSDNNTHS